MKKILLLLCLLIGVGTASAKTYQVTINVLTAYKIVDNSTGQVLDEGYEGGECHKYTVDAPTEEEAKYEAYSKCAGACRSDWRVVDYHYVYNGKACTKSVKQVPDTSSAVAQ